MRRLVETFVRWVDKISLTSRVSFRERPKSVAPRSPAVFPPKLDHVRSTWYLIHSSYCCVYTRRDRIKLCLRPPTSNNTPIPGTRYYFCSSYVYGLDKEMLRAPPLSHTEYLCCTVFVPPIFSRYFAVRGYYIPESKATSADINNNNQPVMLDLLVDGCRQVSHQALRDSYCRIKRTGVAHSSTSTGRKLIFYLSLIARTRAG